MLYCVAIVSAAPLVLFSTTQTARWVDRSVGSTVSNLIRRKIWGPRNATDPSTRPHSTIVLPHGWNYLDKVPSRLRHGAFQAFFKLKKTNAEACLERPINHSADSRRGNQIVDHPIWRHFGQARQVSGSMGQGYFSVILISPRFI